MILDIVSIGAKLIDKLIPDREAAAQAKIKLLELQQSGELESLRASRDIIVAEAASEHALTATWRPVVMLTFTGLVVAHFLGWTAENISEAQVEGLLKIVQYGLTGYIVGRSAEKGIREWKKTS